MQIYEYVITGTAETLEVIHESSQNPETWGDLCEIMNIGCGSKLPETKIERVIAGKIFVNGNLEDSSKGKLHLKTGNGCCNDCKK